MEFLELLSIQHPPAQTHTGSEIQRQVPPVFGRPHAAGKNAGTGNAQANADPDSNATVIAATAFTGNSSRALAPRDPG